MSLTIKSCDADKCPSGCTEHIPITLDIGKKFLSAIYHCKNWMQKGVPYFQILPAGERNAELFAKTFEELNISFTKSVKDGKIQGFALKHLRNFARRLIVSKPLVMPIIRLKLETFLTRFLSRFQEKQKRLLPIVKYRLSLIQRMPLPITNGFLLKNIINGKTVWF